MKLIVTGAAGMLGKAMLDAWFDHEVLGLDRGELDITDPVQIRQTLATIRPQLLINCVGYTDVDRCETEEAVAERVNSTAVGYLAKTCAEHKITLVHISTDYVFSGTKEEGYAEDDEPGPSINAYGLTKLHGEELLRRHAARWYLVRTSWLYGSGGRNFVDTILNLAKTKSELTVVNDQHGKPTFTRDLSGFIKQLVLDRAPYGIYHGVNELASTWYEFATEILRQAQLSTPIKPIKSEALPRPAKRPEWSVLLNTKRPPLRSWQDALRDYLAELGYSG
ncbi:MAG: dTDP-4-dehydrorhamnose reductase [Candidatus Kerfeldbacteria bacterium]|nr:dTDP-4-dehydrorhamnose reductase [Candidatus Kerfeldbacteria bacterium]